MSHMRAAMKTRRERGGFARAEGNAIASVAGSYAKASQSHSHATPAAGLSAATGLAATTSTTSSGNGLLANPAETSRIVAGAALLLLAYNASDHAKVDDNGKALPDSGWII